MGVGKKNTSGQMFIDSVSRRLITKLRPSYSSLSNQQTSPSTPRDGSSSSSTANRRASRINTVAVPRTSSETRVHQEPPTSTNLLVSSAYASYLPGLHVPSTTDILNALPLKKDGNLSHVHLLREFSTKACMKTIMYTIIRNLRDP